MNIKIVRISQNISQSPDKSKWVLRPKQKFNNKTMSGYDKNAPIFYKWIVFFEMGNRKLKTLSLKQKINLIGCIEGGGEKRIEVACNSAFLQQQ